MRQFHSVLSFPFLMLLNTKHFVQTQKSILDFLRKKIGVLGAKETKNKV